MVESANDGTFEPDNLIDDGVDTPPLQPMLEVAPSLTMKSVTIKPKGTRQMSQTKQAVPTYVPTMKGKSYRYLTAQIKDTQHDPRVVEIVLTQLNLKAPIKMWEDDARINERNTLEELI